MKQIKHIHHPVFTSAVKLTSLQFNTFPYKEKHTVLTPELLSSLTVNNGENKN